MLREQATTPADAPSPGASERSGSQGREKASKLAPLLTPALTLPHGAIPSGSVPLINGLPGRRTKRVRGTLWRQRKLARGGTSQSKPRECIACIACGNRIACTACFSWGGYVATREQMAEPSIGDNGYYRTRCRFSTSTSIRTRFPHQVSCHKITKKYMTLPIDRSQ